MSAASETLLTRVKLRLRRTLHSHIEFGPPKQARELKHSDNVS